MGPGSAPKFSVGGYENKAMKPLRKVNIAWSPEFAYAIGLLATDGNLSSDKRHMSLTSRDRDQVKNLARCLGLKNMIGVNASGAGNLSSRIQFGDTAFYQFLLSIGLMPCKSKVLGSIAVPDRYFFDFLRGHFDGDGTFYSYWDSRWKSSFMFYIELVSASKNHTLWLRQRIAALVGVVGRITKSRNSAVYRLKYAKAGSLKLLPKLYYNPQVVCLSRKRLKIERSLRSVGLAL